VLARDARAAGDHRTPRGGVGSSPNDLSEHCRRKQRARFPLDKRFGEHRALATFRRIAQAQIGEGKADLRAWIASSGFEDLAHPRHELRLAEVLLGVRNEFLPRTIERKRP
jgi:hypothetical protein